MSKAIYSEIVELVLDIKNFTDQILASYDNLEDLRQLASRKMPLIADTKDFITDIDRAIQRTKELNAQIREQNKIVQDRKAVATFGPTGSPDDHNAKQVALARLAVEERLAAEKSANHAKYIAQLKAEDAATAKLVETEKARLAVESRIRGTTGYSVGKLATGARVGASLDIAAGAAFAAGSTNLGGAIYMLERFSYATGLGQKNLGELAQKFGLVTLKGDESAASIARFGNGVLKVGTALTAVAAVLGTAFAGAKLDKSLADMSTLLLDATASADEFSVAMTNATVSASKLSSAFGEDISTVVDGFKTALSAGIGADELEQFGAAALTMSKGLNTSFDNAVGILTTFKDAYAGTVTDVVGYSDVLFNAINVGKFNVEQLNSNIGRVAVTASEAGVSFKDMMAALATLTRVGMTTSQSITSLNQMIVSISNPTEKAKKAFDALGIAYGSAAFKGRSLIEVVNEIKNKVGDNADMYGELFGEERGRRGVIGLAANQDLYADSAAEVEKTGTAAIAAARAMDTFGQNLYKLWLNIWNPIQQAGEALLNVFNTLFNGEESLVSFGDVLQATVSIIGSVVVVIGTLATEIVHIVKGLGRAALGVLDLVDALVSLDGGKATAAANAIGSAFSTMMVDIEKTATVAGRGIVSMFDSIGAAVKTSATESILDASNVITSIADTTKIATEAMVEDVSKLYTSLSKKATSALEEIALKQRELARASLINTLGEQYDTANKDKVIKNTLSRDDLSEIDRYNALQNDLKTLNKTPRLNDAQKQRVKDIELELRAIDAYIKARKQANAEDEAANKIAYDRNKLAAINKELVNKGYEEIDKPKGWFSTARKTSDSDVVSGAEGQLEDLRAKFAQLEALGKYVTDGILPDSAMVDKLDKLKAVYDQFKAYIENNSGLLTNEALKRYNEQLAQMSGAISDQEDAIAKKKEKLRKEDVAAHKRAHEAKMSLLKKELGLIDDVIKSLKEQFAALQQAATDNTYDVRGAGYARRDIKDRISVGMQEVKGMSGKAGEDMIKKLMDMIDSFKDYSDKDGNGARGGREAADMIAQLQKENLRIQNEMDAQYAAKAKEIESEKAKARREEERVAEERKKEAEEARKKIEEMDPKEKAKKEAEAKAQQAREMEDLKKSLAVTTIHQSMEAVKTALMVAADHGLQVAGQLNSNVEVNIDANIPIQSLRSAMLDLVNQQITNYLRSQMKGNNPPPEQAGNDTPVGAP